ncbi:hypothetical protein HYC85_030996 [Camellia sinensis]|uniref:Uncharacterized protein n=1 Tax=Camellia sinensis TaxID=4442 RepID=A0A7J7FPN1_CAMSI|nr:hypothetical protein HYC85_030996 [Camellia sinensis]
MAKDCHAERPLFGGGIASTFPLRFQTRPLTDELLLDLQDVSNIRQVPDHQVFTDPARDESLIFELLDLKLEVADNGSATRFLQDLAREQDAEGVMMLNHLLVCPFHLVPYDVYQSMAVSKIPLAANEKQWHGSKFHGYSPAVVTGKPIAKMVAFFLKTSRNVIIVT